MRLTLSTSLLIASRGRLPQFSAQEDPLEKISIPLPSKGPFAWFLEKRVGFVAGAPIPAARLLEVLEGELAFFERMKDPNFLAPERQQFFLAKGESPQSFAIEQIGKLQKLVQLVKQAAFKRGFYRFLTLGDFRVLPHQPNGSSLN